MVNPDEVTRLFNGYEPWLFNGDLMVISWDLWWFNAI